MTAEAEIILQEIRGELRKLTSPWMNRQDAAAYCAGRSPITIDRAADAGKIKRYYPGGDGLPAFKRKELDAWMEGNVESGRGKRGRGGRP